PCGLNLRSWSLLPPHDRRHLAAAHQPLEKSKAARFIDAGGGVAEAGEGGAGEGAAGADAADAGSREVGQGEGNAAGAGDDVDRLADRGANGADGFEVGEAG